jgi:multidrug efflux pump subunit AcrB
MILKTDASGRIVRVRDVARIELGAQGYDQTCTLDLKPSVALSIYQLPGSNAVQAAAGVRKLMSEGCPPSTFGCETPEMTVKSLRCSSRILRYDDGV